MLNILVCQIFQIHKSLFSTSRAITKDTVYWKWSALSKVPTPISEQEPMYLKFMLTWYVMDRLHPCFSCRGVRASTISNLLCRLPVSWAIPKGVNRQQLGREWEGRIRVEFDSAIRLLTNSRTGADKTAVICCWLQSVKSSVRYRGARKTLKGKVRLICFPCF